MDSTTGVCAHVWSAESAGYGSAFWRVHPMIQRHDSHDVQSSISQPHPSLRFQIFELVGLCIAQNQGRTVPLPDPDRKKPPQRRVMDPSGQYPNSAKAPRTEASNGLPPPMGDGRHGLRCSARVRRGDLTGLHSGATVQSDR